jgi:hypothetical protein
MLHYVALRNGRGPYNAEQVAAPLCSVLFCAVRYKALTTELTAAVAICHIYIGRLFAVIVSDLRGILLFVTLSHT